jgi:hypothetical protein
MGVSVSDMVIRNILRFFLPATFVITVSDLLWDHRVRWFWLSHGSVQVMPAAVIADP